MTLPSAVFAVRWLIRDTLRQARQHYVEDSQLCQQRVDEQQRRAGAVLVVLDHYGSRFFAGGKSRE